MSSLGFIVTNLLRVAASLTLKERSMNGFPTSPMRACGSDFMLKPIKLVVDSRLGSVGFLVGLGFLNPGEGRGLKK